MRLFEKLIHFLAYSVQRIAYRDKSALDYEIRATSDERLFYIHDRLGSVRLVVDALGDVLNSYTYDPAGLAFPEETHETVYNPFLFTGQWFDPEIQQYYLRARMYDPRLGVFTSRDPVLGKFQEPLTLHTYLYCINDPVNSIDLNGRSRVFVAQATVAAHGARILAIAMFATSMSMWTSSSGPNALADYMSDVSLTLYNNLPEFMGHVLLGATVETAIVHTVSNNLPREYKWKDKRNIERMIYEQDRGMSGDPEHRNKDPKFSWKRILASILELIDSAKGDEDDE